MVALFLSQALVFGGGTHRAPFSEFVVQVAFAVAALLWIWLPDQKVKSLSIEQRLSFLIPLAILAIPAIQLVPLPPQIWHSLPGRTAAVEALNLVGAADTWRPISEVPLRTLETLLALLPPAGIFWAVSRLDQRERALVPIAVLAIALLTAALGGLQVAAKDGSLSFYSTQHRGWITGFQSNRNHAADLLLSGLLALAWLFKRSTELKAKRTSGRGASENRSFVAIGLGLLLLTALVMTGSRAAISIGLVALFPAIGILVYPAETTDRFPLRAFSIFLAVFLFLGFASAMTLTSQDTSLSRVVARFADLRSERLAIWDDAAYAWHQFWPIGIGAGGFMASMFPAERLENVNFTYPNQAHNDFLEIGIEAGIGGYLTLVGVLAGLIALSVKYWLTDRRALSHTQVIFAGSVLILLTLHSIVDYPLRSMSLACLAGAAGGMLVRPGRRDNAEEVPTKLN